MLFYLLMAAGDLAKIIAWSLLLTNFLQKLSSLWFLPLGYHEHLTILPNVLFNLAMDTLSARDFVVVSQGI